MTDAASDPSSLRPDESSHHRIALCLGAHRSGTSLVTAALEALGADLALPDRTASEENLKGFFEHAGAVALDDDLLRLAGSAWDDPAFDAATLAGLPADALRPLRENARHLVRADWAAAPLAAVKDPRMCRLLPFWLPVLAAEGYDDRNIRCVIVTRDPVEIAISQRTRCRKNPDYYEFGQDLSEGIALWLSHIRQALRDCGTREVLIIAYGDFLARPAALMQSMAAFLGVPADQDAITRFMSEFLDEKLWRSHGDAEAEAEIEAAFPGLLAAERALAACSGQVVSTAETAPILAALDAPEHVARLRQIVSRAYGRLADLRREERQQALRLNHALQVATEARDAFALSRDQVAATAREIEARLRERIEGLEAGIGDRDTRLRQGQERHELVLAEARKVEGNLRNHITGLESGVAERDRQLAQLRQEQEQAIRQIGAAFERNQHELDQTRQETAALAATLQQRDADCAALATAGQELRDNLAQAETGQAALSRQLGELQRVSDYLQHSNDAMRASHSWRVTKPFRQAGSAARTLRDLPKSGLRALNRASQVTHQRLKRSHPRTAELLRSNIQPLMTRANLRLLGQHSVPAPAAPPAPNPPGIPAGTFAFDYQQPRVYPPYRPLVTIIVPNYNHAPYLTQRLESIYAQSYEHYEVLLLDDCSSDDSRQVLSDFAARYADRTRLLFNEENSGGVFRQWEKGLAEARGDLIWIAESDDWASPNFLEALVPFFQNEAVQLAYARTVFMDGAGENQIWSMEEYLHQFSPERWGRAWVETAADIVRDVFSMTNIVPNVSSALFRRFERLDVLEIDAWRGMRTCGDWMFYLNAIRGGMMAYSPDARNFYRIHDKNTSVTSHKADQFYREHEAVAQCLRRHYRVPEENLTRMEANLRHHWKITRDDYSDAAFVACFDRARIEAAPLRKPALLMAGYGFCAGGGETFPIQLANEMKGFGYEVTFLDCAQEERVEGIRAMLATDIPVISNFPDLRRIVQNFDIDLIHSHHGWVDNTVLDLLPPDGPVQTVVTLHGFYETVPPQQLKMLLPRLIERSGGLVYTAEKNLGAIRQAGLIEQRPLHRIDNALSKSEVSAIDRASLGIAEDAFLLTLVSRALHSKGWAEAVAAVTRARDISGKDIQLILIGEGEARDALVAAGPDAHLHLEGFRQNIRDYFAASDLGFLPSRFPGESFPLVIIDSLNAGTPVLASDIGEIGYMLTTDEGPAGALFALDADWQIDVEALAAQIATLASNPEEMARLRARVAAAAARFDPHLMARKYDAVYTTVTAREGRT